MTAPRFLTLTEAAKVSGLDKTTLRRLADRGRVPTAKMPEANGRRGWRLFRRSDMEALKRRIEERFSDVVPEGGVR